MDLTLFIETISYVCQAPYFWQSLGFTTAIFMFIGGIVYDGRIDEAKKGVVTIGAYMFMLLWITLLRVNDRISASDVFQKLSRQSASMAFAGIVTILFITVACIIGITLGVVILRYGKYIGKFYDAVKEKVNNFFKY